ncbi:MAG: hypothetical protein IT361_11150 [Gemmatimonadaceae bacterium]|nr:hypothetical protein [Gemmatimonadaceae bacterium]
MADPRLPILSRFLPDPPVTPPSPKPPVQPADAGCSTLPVTRVTDTPSLLRMPGVTRQP